MNKFYTQDRDQNPGQNPDQEKPEKGRPNDPTNPSRQNERRPDDDNQDKNKKW